MNKHAFTIVLSAILLSMAMHWPHLHKDLMSVHVWRQTQTQTVIDNFYEEDASILNPRQNDRGNGDGVVRFEFPLMQWLVAMSYHVFGQNILVTRLWMFLLGMLSIIGMYRFIFELFVDSRIAAFTAWAFCFSPLIYYYMICPLPDNLALCAGIWALVLTLKWQKEKRLKHIVGAFLLIGVSALCKLPFILYLSAPLYLLIKEKKLLLATSLSLFILPAIRWYAWVIPTWENPTLNGPTGSDLYKRLGYIGHNLTSTLPELLLNYGAVLLFLVGILAGLKNKFYASNKGISILWLLVSLTGYYLYEVDAIGTDHDYYFFPFYPVIFSLVALGIKFLLEHKTSWTKPLVYFIVAILPLTCYLRMKVRWNEDAPGFNKNLLVHKQDLRKTAPDSSLVIVANDESHQIFLYYIDKKGWAIDHDKLTAEALKEMINKGAEYFYCDSRSLDTSPWMTNFLKEEIGSYGSIHVYSLKHF